MEQLEILINVHGDIVHASEATVSAMDHGFLYGDSVYETLRSFARRPFMVERHLERLERSLERIFLDPPCSRKDFEREIERTLVAHGERYGTERDVSLRIVVTRGPGAIGLDPSLCDRSRFLIYAWPVPSLNDSLAKGIAVVVSRVRRNHPSALDPGIKSGNFLNNILAYRDAKTAGAQEAILLNANGHVAEGTTSNVFVVSGGVVRTPTTFGILDGITRALVIEEARGAGIDVEEVELPAESLMGADEVFITSSVRGVAPVVRVNSVDVGEGAPGPITQRIMRLYDERITRECGGAA